MVHMTRNILAIIKSVRHIYKTNRKCYYYVMGLLPKEPLMTIVYKVLYSVDMVIITIQNRKNHIFLFQHYYRKNATLFHSMISTNIEFVFIIIKVVRYYPTESSYLFLVWRILIARMCKTILPYDYFQSQA